MKEPYGEGLAIHTDPESCACVREGVNARRRSTLRASPSPARATKWAGSRWVLRTEKSRLRRRLADLRDLMRRGRHLPLGEQLANLNQVLRGHHACYGIGGNTRTRCPASSSAPGTRGSAAAKAISGGRCSPGSRRAGRCSDPAWLRHTGSSRPSPCRDSLCEERRAGTPHAPSRGSRKRVTASGDPVGRG